MNKCIFLFLSFVVCVRLQAQELNCQVNIVVDNKVEVSSTEQEIINQMKQSITEIMNNTAWTKDKFKVEERINCNIQIQIREIPATGAYRGDFEPRRSKRKEKHASTPTPSSCRAMPSDAWSRYSASCRWCTQQSGAQSERQYQQRLVAKSTRSDGFASTF